MTTNDYLVMDMNWIMFRLYARLEIEVIENMLKFCKEKNINEKEIKQQLEKCFEQYLINTSMYDIYKFFKDKGASLKKICENTILYNEYRFKEMEKYKNANRKSNSNVSI